MKNTFKIRITLEKGDETVAHTMCESTFPEVFMVATQNLETLKTWVNKNKKELMK